MTTPIEMTPEVFDQQISTFTSDALYTILNNFESIRISPNMLTFMVSCILRWVTDKERQLIMDAVCMPTLYTQTSITMCVRHYGISEIMMIISLFTEEDRPRMMDLICARDSNGWTWLTECSIYNAAQIATYLLNIFTEEERPRMIEMIFEKDKEGRTCFDWCATYDAVGVFLAIIQHIRQEDKERYREFLKGTTRGVRKFIAHTVRKLDTSA